MDPDCNITAKPKTIWEFFRSWYFWRPFLGTAAGSAGGFLYYYYIGCTSGACAITSNPLGSIIMGALLGFMVTGSPCLRNRQV